VALRNLPLGDLLQLPIVIFQAGYSKEQEMEADRDGTALAVMAGYSPQGAVRMFQTFERLNREYVQKAESPQEELSQIAIQTLEGYFRSHPLPQERQHQIQALIISEKWPERKERPLRVRVEAGKG
jgi:predicted Zn-dependent protease